MFFAIVKEERKSVAFRYYDYEGEELVPYGHAMMNVMHLQPMKVVRPVSTESRYIRPIKDEQGETKKCIRIGEDLIVLDHDGGVTIPRDHPDVVLLTQYPEGGDQE